MKKILLTILLVGMFFSVSDAAVSERQKKAMSTFLSNFTELWMMNFNADDALNPKDPAAAIRFGIWHNYVNNYESKIVPCKDQKCPHGSLTIDAKFVADSIERYFGLKFTAHKSIDNSEYKYFYDGKLYHFEGADGEATYFARVKEVEGPTNGIYTATGELYDSNDESEIMGTFTAKFKSHKWDGKDTYAIINFDAKIDGDEDDQGETPLMKLAGEGTDPKELEPLMAGANLEEADEIGWTAMFYAANNEKTVEMVKALAKAGANVNARSKTDETPLISAVQNQSAAMALALIELGADINAVDMKGNNVLMNATGNSAHSNVVETLIKAGANVNAKTIDNITALMLAVRNGNGEAMEALIKNGADVNVQHYEGETALMIAAASDPILTEILLDAGADVKLKNKQGKTAFDIANENWDKNIDDDGKTKKALERLK